MCNLIVLIHAFLNIWEKSGEEIQHGWRVSTPEHWKIEVKEQVSGNVLQLLRVSSG